MNDKAGQHTFRGINTQAQAAISLFLQYLSDARQNNFSYIHLEAPKFQDFNLVFSDGRKIICESKDRKIFTFYHLSEILKNIISKNQISKNDEILIISTNISKNLLSAIKKIRYFDQENKIFEEKGYDKAMISLLPLVKFWQINTEFLPEIAFSLFASLLPFWLPQERIEEIVNNILVKEIYYGSAIGATYSRVDISKKIENLANKVRKESVHYDQESRKLLDQIKTIKESVENPNHKTWESCHELSALSAQRDLFLFFIHSFRENNKQNISLKDWDNAWELSNHSYFSSEILKIFSDNLYSEENKKYVLDYCKKNAGSISGYYYRYNFLSLSIIDILNKILDDCGREKHLEDSFSVIKDLLFSKLEETLHLKKSNETNEKWERDEICEVLNKIYNYADIFLKEKIYNYVISNFNITKDDGNINLYTPKSIYKILETWLNEDFANRFPTLVKELTKHYCQYYQEFDNKIKFDGWEISGGMSSFFGDEYHIPDRCFIRMILIPSISEFYHQNKEQGWDFIKKHCLAKEKQVSKEKPDFLNRSIYGIVLERYADKDENISNEAFSILKEFILSTKGIPHKSNLIYQNIIKSDIPDEKKWKLVELTIQKYGIPPNVLSEKVVNELAKNGLHVARNQLKNWYKNTDYYKGFGFGLNYTSNIQAQLDNDLNFGIELFEILLTSEYAKTNENFNGYLAANTLRNILKKDYQKGLSILRRLELEDQLSSGQQITYFGSLFNTQGNDESDNEALLLQMYNDIVDPFITKHNDNFKVIQRLTNARARELLTQFASRLATKNKISQALRIIRISINDPDPDIQPKNILSGDESRTIESVRGWCAWVLMKCSAIEGRKYLPEIIELVKILINDENYYVINMASSALEQISKNRLAVLEEGSETFFLNDDRKTALQMAKEVEAIAFTLLKKFESWPSLVQKALAKSCILRVFNSIKSLNEQEALSLVTTLSGPTMSADIIVEFITLFIYYAEYRKSTYKNWKLGLPGFYDDISLGKYNEKKFKTILVEAILRIKKEAPNRCYELVISIENMTQGYAAKIWGAEKCEEVAIRYFSLVLDTYSRDVFNSIYRNIENNLKHTIKHKEDWYNLFINCLTIERNFYEEQYKLGSLSQAWHLSSYHSNLLTIIYEEMGEHKFMNAARIFFFPPKVIILDISDPLIAIIRMLKNSTYHSEIEMIVDSLFDRNPIKYLSLKKEFA